MGNKMRNSGKTKEKILNAAILVVLLFVFGTPAHANMTASPTSVNFGNQAVGTTSAPTQVTVTVPNKRRWGIQVVSASLSPVQFSYSGPSLPITLYRGQSATVSVTFAPTAAQAYIGTLVFTLGNGSTIAVTMTGTGVQAAAQTRPPTITTPPASQTVTAGQTATFTVAATGTSPMTYQWKKNGTAISGSTSSMYTTLPTTTSDNAAQFTVGMTNSAGSATSSAATLTVNTAAVAPSITTQPASQTVTVGQTATFSVTASGTAPLSYQWRRNGTAISGATSASYATPPATISDSGSPFAVTVSNSTGSVTSNTAILTVDATPVAITVNPNNATVTVGSAQQFVGNVTGTSNTAATWTVSGAGCTGAACGTISVNGLYVPPVSVPSPPTVTVKAISVADPTKSASASVTIVAAVAVLLSISPTSASVPTSGTQLFTASVTGTSNMAVSWSVSGAGCSGSSCGTISTSASSAVYSAPTVPPSPPSVAVNATSVADPTKSASASVTIVLVVVVTVSPTNASVSTGTTQQFNASVSGTSNTGVIWSVSGTGCNGLACGMINSSGLYTAPTTAPSPASAVVTATSVADPTKSATVTLSIVVTVAEEITREATALNSDTNHPLPLMASWEAGTQWNYNTASAGYTPDWQVQTIASGHHLLPWFVSPDPEMLCTTQTCQNNGSLIWPSYYQNAINSAAANNLPITLNATQWEHYLIDDPTYYNLPPSQSPDVVGLDGVVHTIVNQYGTTLATLSPFGAIGPWYDVGKKWGSSLMMTQLQGWYPNPPLVIFLSNNEALKLAWTDVETDLTYVNLYGLGRSDDFKRQVVAAGWITRYRQLQQGFRDGLINSSWKAKAVFVGYEAFGPRHFGRWSGWMDYSLYIPNRIDPSPLMWDGGSPSFYLAPSNPPTDDHVYSPQVEVMNYPFMMSEALQLNPTFWFELSTTNGCDWYPPNLSDTGCQTMLTNMPNYTPERYAGMVQFGMWTIRPRVVRDWRAAAEPRTQSEPYFTALEGAVDRVYVNPILQRFWRQGQLVANPALLHPYETNIPVEYASASRMFMLSTSADPSSFSNLSTAVSAYVLARVIGQSPQRTWLVYVDAPNGPINQLTVTIPNYRNIQVNADSAGEFYLVDETNSTVSLVGTN